MDEKHIFAEGLELVTSLVFYKDGVIVAQAPDILWLRDVNGDGRCDTKAGREKITLYTGFGTFDTHAVINNFRWGLDGWVYSAIGYSAGHPKSPDGSKDFGRVSAGVIRFRPDGSALEQYASGSCNTWGFDFAPDGELFYTTATCGEHFLHIVMPEQILARGNVGGVRASWVVPDHQEIAPAIEHTHPAYRQIDWVGMFTATAGCTMYNGGAWPDRFDGSHFCSETTMHLVHHEFLRPKGVTYVAGKESGREDTEFIAGTDLWFRPVHTRVGPDGALYVVDFYNQAAIHNDTRGPAHGANNAATRPDRDHHFGRVWRVQHREAKAIDYPDLNRDQPANLVEALKNKNGWVRNTAARLLRENGAGDQLDELKQLAQNEALPGPNRITALYTLNSLGELTDPMLVSAVNDNNGVVRKNALRIAYERDLAPAGSEGLEAVKTHLDDANPRARLNALIALGNFEPSEEIASAIVTAWPDLDGKYLQSAAVGVAARDPLLYVEASFQAETPAFLAAFIPHAVRILANEQNAPQAARLVTLLA
jgi:putative membrane-bound dehydrogenase-like protein